jgi:poly-gamma-glutamate synthesis protein (capsule biosynthesis protein)
MEKRYTFKEHLLRLSKKHKKKLTLHTSILAAVTGILIVFSAFWTLAEVPEVEKDEDAVLTASFVGDLMFGRYIEEVINAKGYDYLFKYSDPYFQVSDFATGNFSQPIQVPGKEQPANEDQQITFSTTPESVEALVERNFKSVSIANNNSHDHGFLGFIATNVYFQEHDEIDAAGFMKEVDPEAVDHAVYYEHNGLTIATLGASDIVAPNAAAVSFRQGIMPLGRPELIMESILKASEQADLVLVHVHWGEAYDTSVSNRQRDLARAMSRAGADVIIGHFPHVLAPIEVYNDTVIFYSLGNFISDQGWSRTKQTSLAQYRLYEDGQAEIELIPFVISDGQARPTSNNSFREKSIFSMLTKDMDDSQWRMEDGHIVIPLNHERVISEEGS